MDPASWLGWVGATCCKPLASLFRACNRERFCHLIRSCCGEELDHHLLEQIEKNSVQSFLMVAPMVVMEAAVGFPQGTNHVGDIVWETSTATKVARKLQSITWLQLCWTIKMFSGLKEVNKRFAAQDRWDHYDLGSYREKKAYVITVHFSPFAASQPPTHYPIETRPCAS